MKSSMSPKIGGFMEEPVFDSLREDLLAVFVKLYIPHCLPAQQMLMSKIAAANPGEQGKMTHSQKHQ